MLKKVNILLAISALTVGLIGCNTISTTTSGSAGSNTEKLAIAYNNPDEWANFGTIHKQFKEQTGIKVPNDNKNSGQAMTALIAEKANPVADVVYYGIVFGSQAMQKDLVEGYKPAKFNEIPDPLKEPDGKWMAIHYGAISFIVNKEALGNTPVPQSWADLLKPEYKGKVGFLDPTSAAVGYSVTVAANMAMGGTLDNWEPGIEYLQKLEKNDVIHPKATANAKVMKGEIPILIDADFNGYKMKYDENAPIEVVIPKEGSLKVPYTVSLVKNAPHKEAGKQYIDFMLSDEGQKLFAEGYVRPIRSVDISEEVKKKFLPDSEYERVKAVDYNKMNEVQNGFIERWKSQVSAK
ncbi:ABC transporter substrate-binding protein [Aneurinibacillus migulanus]|uniref:extracellular solute-binding protein n=1 Tax=Aneurinibacillus migulanus TaxID=47500 RepID=UPI0005BE4694|nr:extracellular solute-binding protein [Aneurinibacillus migulanus]KIV59725.1 ABC transporter substrate-binding protein [Aneurinibacillus migulanus]KPD09795.1 ABC transporter substrate-binding protein [Aneurinibacillus migulanus]